MFHYFFWNGMWFGWAFWIILLIIIILVVSKRSANNQPPNNAGHNETPLDILKKRYAKGQISKEQFEQMKKDIQ